MPLSIGAKLTLQYTAAIAVTLTVVALFVYAEVTRRVNREAKLLLEVEMRELADELQSMLRPSPDALAMDPAAAAAPSSGWTESVLLAIRERFDRLVRSSDPSLRVGIALVSADGTYRVRTGVLLQTDAPLPTSVLRGSEQSSLRAANLGEPFAYLSMAMAVPGGAVQMVLSTERYAENIRRIRDVFLLAFPVIIVFTALGGYLLAHTTLSPIRAMIGTARRISTANLGEKIPLTGSGDELDRLASTLNGMLSRIEDGLSRMRRFNANAAHELRTPLTGLSSLFDVTLERDRQSEEYRRVLFEAHERVRELSGVVDAMLRLARTEAGIAPRDRVLVSVDGVLENVQEFFEPVASEEGVELVAGTPPRVQVSGDASWLHQLFANLVANAIKFTPPGGRVTLTSEVDKGELRVRVQDSGPGIPLDEIPLTFERFQRGREGKARSGYGLGLAIAREIARAHGGEIDIEASASGAIFCVRLPVVAGDAELDGVSRMGDASLIVSSEAPKA